LPRLPQRIEQYKPGRGKPHLNRNNYGIAKAMPEYQIKTGPASSMNQKELKELIEFLIEKDIAEFELERGDVKVKIKRAAEPAPLPLPDSRYLAVHPAPGEAGGHHASAPARLDLAGAAAAVPEPEEEDLHIVKSPIVGTFYESPSPGSPPFVKPGDRLEVGQVLCIVEAMKLMNEIECDVAGELVKRLVANGQPIEYGQELFAVRLS
jgi:acetyl-CoA carboxylase biotin carboxyl carrier protein